MPWNYMQIEVIPSDRLIRPTVGPGGLTRAAALAEIQGILDRAAAEHPGMAPVAAAWRRGPKDDTCYAGPFAWTVYEHRADEDPRVAASAWLAGYAQTIRDAGVDVTVAAWPETG